MNNKTTYLSLLLLFFCSLPLMAQQKLKFSIVDFYQAPTDLSAKNPQYNKNPREYAIIKVLTDNPDDDLRAFKFNFGSVAHYIEVVDDELWLYVQRNGKFLTIKREGYATINRYDLGETIEAGKTYVLQLSVQMPEVKHRILQFKVTPVDENAIIYLKREGEAVFQPWGTTDATGSKADNMETGIYYYEVVAPNYEKVEGCVALTYAEEKLVEEVSLKPNFGFLQINTANGMEGAQIFVDGRQIGTIPYNKKDRWGARDDYKLVILNGNMYKPYTDTFSIEKGETTIITPLLEKNFAVTTIIVDGDADAEIFVNGESRGKGTWSGELVAGTYDVECRKDKHHPFKRQITVRADEADTYLIDAPKAMEGSIFVNSTPLDAKVMLDGKEVGITPCTLKNILIGDHTLTIQKPDYKEEVKVVTVKENETNKIDVELKNMGVFTIKTRPSGGTLYIDSENVGTTPYTKEMASGDYEIKITRNKFSDYKKRVHLDSSHPELTIYLTRQYQQSLSGYLQPTIQAGTLMGYGVNAGVYIANVNLQVDYLMGAGKSDEVCWNYIGTDDYRPVAETFTPTVIGGKVGYGIVVGTRLRVTPQIGVSAVSLKGDQQTKCFAAYASPGVKVDYALISGIGVSIAPEFGVAVSKSDTYTRLETASSKIKSWAGGFNLCAGIYLYF